MKTDEIVIDGQKQTIVVDFPDEMIDEYIDVDLEDTIELDEIVQQISGEYDE